MKKFLAKKYFPVIQKIGPLSGKNGNKYKAGIYSSKKTIRCKKFRLTSFDGLLLSSFLFFSGTLPAFNTGDDTKRKQIKGGNSVAVVRKFSKPQALEPAKMFSLKEMDGQMALSPPLYGDAFNKKHTFFAENHLSGHGENFLQENRAPHSFFTFPGFQRRDETIIAFYQNLKGVKTSLQNQKLKIEQQQLFLYGISTLSILSFSVLVFTGLKIKTRQIRSKRNGNETNTKELCGVENRPEPFHPSFENKKLKTLYQQILYLFEVRQIFLDPSLNLYKIARKLHTNEKYISKAIHQGSGENFPVFVSAYRFRETLKTMKNPRFNDLTLAEIRKKSGFFSQSTFCSTIKKFTGRSPGRLKKCLQSEKNQNPVFFSYPAFLAVNSRKGSAPFQNLQ